MTNTTAAKGLKGVGSLMTSESAVKSQNQPFKEAYVLKIEFEVESTPGEILRTIQNEGHRMKWDMDLAWVKPDRKRKLLLLKYESSDKSFPAYEEEIKIEYFNFEGCFMVIETSNSIVIGEHYRVWIMKPLVHRP